ACASRTLRTHRSGSAEQEDEKKSPRRSAFQDTPIIARLAAPRPSSASGCERSRGVVFRRLRRLGPAGIHARPAGKIGASGDQAGAALVSDIGPRPLDKDQKSILEADQEENVNEEPGKPGHKSRDVNPAELGDG